jgi:hypothetical protein
VILLFFGKKTSGGGLTDYNLAMKRFLLLSVILFTFSLNFTLSQPRPYINEIIDQIKTSANAYFLAANRPGYGISSYLTPKGFMEFGTGIYFNKDIYDIPLDISYGISNKVELSGGMTMFSQSFNYLGEKVRGVGDSYLGFKFKFHESKYFDHTLQVIIKIPTASKLKELGTGKFDFHFGLAQGFGYKNFNYDLAAGLSFLARREFPQLERIIPIELRAQLDSLKQYYNYRYEPEISFSFAPGFYIGKEVYIYSGYSFIRNTKLNFNASSILSGLGLSFGKRLGVSLGGSFGIAKNSGWIAGIGINYVFFGR